MPRQIAVKKSNRFLVSNNNNNLHLLFLFLPLNGLRILLSHHVQKVKFTSNSNQIASFESASFYEF